MSAEKILIVDDDLDSVHGLNAQLRAAGYDTAMAVDGMSAVMVARFEKPNLILLDLGLPAGDGFVVLERLAANIGLAVVPVIVISARSRVENAEKAMALGAGAYFEKPADKDVLLRVIAKLLTNGASSRDFVAY